MRVHMISADTDLQKALLESKCFDDVSISESLSKDIKADILIISDKMMSTNNFLLIQKEEISNYKYVFYMLSNGYQKTIENTTNILESRGINIIPPKLTLNQIVERIVNQVVPYAVNHKNIITFYGADSKVGTSMIAQGVSELLAEQSKKKILYLTLDGTPGLSYIKLRNQDSTLGLDNIKVKLINEILTPTELLDTCIQRDNLYILRGANYILDIRHYSPDVIEYLIQLAAENFTAVIIDSGSNIDSGMTIAALNSTVYKYLVTTQQSKSKENFIRIKSQVFDILGIDPKDFMIVVNKHINDNLLDTPAQIAEQYKMTLAGYIPYLDLLGWQAEYDRKNLIHYGNSDYVNAINEIVKLIATQLQIPLSNEHEKRGIFERIFGGRKIV